MGSLWQELRAAVGPVAETDTARLFTFVEADTARRAERCRGLAAIVARTEPDLPCLAVDLAAVSTVDNVVPQLHRALREWCRLHGAAAPGGGWRMGAMATLLGGARAFFSGDFDGDMLQARLAVLYGSLARQSKGDDTAARVVILLDGDEAALGGQAHTAPPGQMTPLERMLYVDLEPRLAALRALLVVATPWALAPRPAILNPVRRPGGEAAAVRSESTEPLRAWVASLDPQRDRASWTRALWRLAEALPYRPGAGEPDRREALACYEQLLAAGPDQPELITRLHHRIAGLQIELRATADPPQMADLLAHLEQAATDYAARGELTLLADARLQMGYQLSAAADPDQHRRAIAVLQQYLADAGAGVPKWNRCVALRALARAYLLVDSGDGPGNVRRAIAALDQARGCLSLRAREARADVDGALACALLNVYGPDRAAAVERALRSARRAAAVLWRRYPQSASEAVLCEAQARWNRHTSRPGEECRRAAEAIAHATRRLPADFPTSLRARLLAAYANGLLFDESRDLGAATSEAMVALNQALRLTSEAGDDSIARYVRRVCAVVLATVPGPGRASRQTEAMALIEDATDGTEQCAWFETAGVVSALPGPHPVADAATLVRMAEAALAEGPVHLQPRVVTSACGAAARHLARLPRGCRQTNVAEGLVWAERARQIAADAGDVQLVSKAAVSWGSVLTHRRDGSLDDARRAAVAAIETGLEASRRRDQPRTWAGRMAALGLAWSMPPHTAESLERAVRCFEQALTVVTEQALPDSWSAVQTALGRARQLQGDATGARGCFEAALRFATPAEAPLLYAEAQHHLGELAAAAGEVDAALEHFDAAQTIRTRDNAPHWWAETEAAKGVALASVNPAAAAGHFEAALTVQTPGDLPDEHEETRGRLERLRRK